MAKYQCIQFGQCPKADASEDIEIQPGMEPRCPGCQQGLIEVGRKPLSSSLRIGILVMVGILFLGGGAWFLLRDGGVSRRGSVEQSLVEVWPWLKESGR